MTSPWFAQSPLAWLAAGTLLAAPAPAAASSEEPAPSPAPVEELPLPVWTREEWRQVTLEAAPPLSGGLLPGLGEGPSGVEPEGPGPVLAPRYPDGPPAFADSLESFRNGLSLFLPEGLSPALPEPALSPQRGPTPVIQLRDVTPEFLAAAASWPGDDPLIDPGAELGETPAEDLRRFLAYHAEESRIPILVLLLAGNEKLPPAAPLETVAGGLAGTRRAALLVYPLGEPWRARLFLPRAAHQAVSTAYLTRLMEACLASAATTSQPDSQLHEFVVQLSIRLFWLEKELAKNHPSALAPKADDEPAQPLAEVGPETPLAPLPVEVAPPALALGGFELPPASIATIAALLGVLLAVAVRRLVRGAKKAAKDRRHRHIWTLPEQGADPRLGGAFCGGAGAWGRWK